MKIVIFGLSVSSAWGNGHATIWRGLLRAMAQRGHRVIFFERDVPYYAATRDLFELPGGELILYPEWADILPQAERHLSDADVAIVTSYCPDALPATDLVLSSRALARVFYDLDTGVTLTRVKEGLPVAYLGPRGLRDFDLVLSYTGGRALDKIKTRLGARRVAPLFGCVDPAVHHPVPVEKAYRADLSFLGTFAEGRQQTLVELLIEPARSMPHRRFLIGGSLYPPAFPWVDNIRFADHVPPSAHPAFYSSSRLTLNVTRRAMAETGYCPSARLFEAAACGAPILSDDWEGLGEFFEPGKEILVAHTTKEACAAIEQSDGELLDMARAARERTLAMHTADIRAAELENLLESALHPADYYSHSDKRIESIGEH